MNQITKPEYAGEILGTVPARFFNVVTADNGRILNQAASAYAREYTERKHRYRIRAELRFDDSCRSGHETFSITGTIDRWDRGAWRADSCGCNHKDIAKRYPDLAPLIQWHLVSTAEPLHYIANTIYSAGDRDCRGRRKGEVSDWDYGVRFGNSPVTHTINRKFFEFLQARQGTGQYIRADFAHDDVKTYGTQYSVQGYADKWHVCPFRTKAGADEFIAALNTCAVEFVKIPSAYSEGKTRELDHARSSAIWPEATDAELCQEPEALVAMLVERHPALMARFKAAMLAVGFEWPKITGDE